MRKFFRIFTLLLLCLLLQSEAAANSSEAFLSLPFGHSWTRTKIRMEKSGATVTSEKKGVSLTAKGIFEGRDALLVFHFTAKKGLSSKTVSIGSNGNPQDDRDFYDILRMAIEGRFGQIQERATTASKTNVALRSHWAPDQHSDITLTFNPNVKRFSGDLIKDSPIRLSYITKKWN